MEGRNGATLASFIVQCPHWCEILALAGIGDGGLPGNNSYTRVRRGKQETSIFNWSKHVSPGLRVTVVYQLVVVWGVRLELGNGQ